MSNIMFDQVGLDEGTPYRKGQWQEIATHDANCIKGFFGDYRFLSNFWPAKVSMSGCAFPTVENAYQAAKFTQSKWEYFQTCSAAASKRYAIEHQSETQKENWSLKKVAVMSGLLQQKFNFLQNPELCKLLHETGDRYLEETNWWDDVFWGVNLHGSGKNMLGRLLMSIRDEQSIIAR